MRRLLILLAMLSAPAVALAEPFECGQYMMEEHDIGPPMKVSGTDSVYEKALRSSLERSGGGFCEAYILGRFLIINERYEEAIAILKDVPLEENSRFLCCNPVLNLIGFAHLMLDRVEVAAEYFKEQSEIAEFERLGEMDRMKTLNNLGYSLVLLGRYEEARAPLERAVALGSEKAGFNLRRIDSIVASLSRQAIDSPGAFAAVISSYRDLDDIRGVRRDLADRLGVDEREVHVFTSDGRRFYFSYGASLSYPLAERRLEAARAAGFPDAWLSLTSRWTDLSGGLSASR